MQPRNRFLSLLNMTWLLTFSVCIRELPSASGILSATAYELFLHLPQQIRRA